MRKQFNKDSYLKLWKIKKRLKEQGKFLIDHDSVQEKKLRSYIRWIEDQILWNSRKEYVKILESFGNKEISFKQ